VTVAVVVVPPSCPDPLPPSDEPEATGGPSSEDPLPLPELPLGAEICVTPPPLWSSLPDPLLAVVVPPPEEEPLLNPDPPSSDPDPEPDPGPGPPWDPS
jgi:hypothetical protein